MSIDKRITLDAFNTLCTHKLGAGQFRDVFAMRFDPSKVVKIERNAQERWCNVLEWTMWQDWKDCDKIAKWLAPCHHLSEGGHVLIMDRTSAPSEDGRELPKQMPRFLTDLKPSNYGFIGKRLVCHDYAFTLTRMDFRPRRVKWWI